MIDRKESRGKTFLVVDGGLHHQLAASGNFGQVIRRNYPVAVGSRSDSDATETVSIVGCLCTPLDLLADNMSLPKADVGDLVVIFQAGAYDGRRSSPREFRRRPYASHRSGQDSHCRVADVKAVVVTTLGLQARAETLDATTALLGSLPELDSMAVLELITAFEHGSESGSRTRTSAATSSRRSEP